MICRRSHARRDASILIGLLWCVVLLALLVVGLLHSARMDLMVFKNYGDRLQAHYLAIAGIEKAKALLYLDARERSRSQRSYSATLLDSPNDFRDVRFGRGMFRIVHRGRNDQGGDIQYGVSEEESRLNINTASLEALGKLDQMTPDVAAAIIDWRDGNNTVTPGGAEADYYAGFKPPYAPRNGPLQTIRESLMIRGINREQLLGRDTHGNGLLDTSDAINSDLELGWATMLTVNSGIENVSASGSTRVDVKTADETALKAVSGMTPEAVKAIIAYRGENNNKLKSIADLLDVPVPQNQNQNQNSSPRSSRGRSSGTTSTPSASENGPKAIDDDLLMKIADELTVDSNPDSEGLVNVNSASREVLMCLPGISRELAQAIVAYRESAGFFQNVAYLLKVPGINRELFKQVAPLVTVRSETFRILSEGVVSSTGTRQRVEEIVRIRLHTVKTIAYREDDL